MTRQPTIFNPSRLNLGCGHDYRTGYLNVDFPGSLYKTDETVNLSQFPWPWPNDSIDEVLMWHVFEHLPDSYAVMREVRRIMKPGGRFHGQVPFGNSHAAQYHPQHYRQFDVGSFDTLADECPGFRVRCSLVTYWDGWKRKLRNVLLPTIVRKALWFYVCDLFDAVDFEFTKL
jgi:SAM-dependent methyltransferase